MALELDLLAGRNRFVAVPEILERNVVHDEFAVELDGPYGNRTHDSALRGLRLNRLTKGPYIL